ncbi:MAG: hypothetical protein FVQ79_02820 [Planctomycetes bacterium]|nr:hypothetical protein [Planctomycetota bacterium]
MSITFRCPECNGVCAFEAIHAGRRARCQECDTVFIIPSADGGKAEKVKIKEVEGDGDAFSGFYRAALVETWGLFTKKENAAGLALVVTLVTIKFFLWNFNFIFAIPTQRGTVITVYLFFGLGIGAITLGILFWYCMEIIYSTGYGTDNLPTNSMGAWVDFAITLLRSLYVFIVVMAIVQLPTLAVFGILKFFGLDWWWVLAFPIAAGLFAFAMGILIVSISADVFSVLRIDHIVRSIRKVFAPYCVCAAAAMIALILGFVCRGFNFKMLGDNFLLAMLSCIGNFAGGIAAVIAARWIGLVFRHYSGYIA